MLTEDQKKIRQWRNEQYRHTQFKSQSDYVDHCKLMKKIREDCRNGSYATLNALHFDLVNIAGFGIQQGRKLANAIWVQEHYGD